MFLTAEEVASLTGKVRHTAQARALNIMRINHRVRPDGSLAVLRSHVEEILRGRTPAKAKSPVEPNWEAIHPKTPTPNSHVERS